MPICCLGHRRHRHYCRRRCYFPAVSTKRSHNGMHIRPVADAEKYKLRLWTDAFARLEHLGQLFPRAGGELRFSSRRVFEGLAKAIKPRGNVCRNRYRW